MNSIYELRKLKVIGLTDNDKALKEKIRKVVMDHHNKTEGVYVSVVYYEVNEYKKVKKN
jgi:hypothetical protein